MSVTNTRFKAARPMAKKIRYRRRTTISPATDEPIGGVASVEDMLTLALVMAVMIVDMAIRG